jgi:hypothetical protein
MPVTTTDDPAFHFPPDVFEALVQAIPLLTRGKKDVLTFLQGCGVSRDYLRTLEPWVARGSDRSKYAITREIVKHLNELGDQGLAARRRVIQRVAEFDDFSLCYPDNQLKAKGAVSTLTSLVDRKDSFTRMKEQREEDERKHRAEQRQAEQRQAAEKLPPSAPREVRLRTTCTHCSDALTRSNGARR